jgi:hypothetical protein
MPPPTALEQLPSVSRMSRILLLDNKNQEGSQEEGQGGGGCTLCPHDASGEALSSLGVLAPGRAVSTAEASQLSAPDPVKA